MPQPSESLSIVLPVYNEAGNVERVLRDIHQKLAARLSDVEFVVAEDGSTDGTPEILKRLAPELGLRVVSGRERKGYTGAVKDALPLAEREWIFFTDSDGQQEPEDFFRLAARAEMGADLVVGVKTPRQDPWPRLALSRGMALANRLLLGARFRDANCGFRLMRRSLVQKILPQVHLLPQFINTEMTLRSWAAGYQVEEVPVRHYARTDGGSRGLPPTRIPSEVALLLRGLLVLRRELAEQQASADRKRKP